MTTKTVNIESVPRGEQVVIGGTVSTVHKTGSVYAILTKTRRDEFPAGHRVTYSTNLTGVDGVQRCTTHGPKAQRPGGIWFCRTCYRQQQATYRARKSGRAEPVAVTKATGKARRMDVVGQLAATTGPSQQQMRVNLLLAAARSGSAVKGSQAKQDRWSRCAYTAAARQQGLTVEQANDITGLAIKPMEWSEYHAARRARELAATA